MKYRYHVYAIYRKLKHPNIVGFRGQGLTEDGRNMLAMENLDTALFLILEERNENEEGPLSSHQIKRVSCSSIVR